MKKLLYILLFISFSASAQIKVGVNFDKNSPTDNSYNVKSRNVKGGYHEGTKLDRDSLLTFYSTALNNGMTFYCTDVDSTFRYLSGAWVAVAPGNLLTGMIQDQTTIKQSGGLYTSLGKLDSLRLLNNNNPYWLKNSLVNPGHLGIFARGTLPTDTYEVISVKSGGGAYATSNSHTDSPGWLTFDKDYTGHSNSVYYFGGNNGYGYLGYVPYTGSAWPIAGVAAIRYSQTGNVDIPLSTSTFTTYGIAQYNAAKNLTALSFLYKQKADSLYAPIGSSSFIANGTSLQTSANLNIDGSGGFGGNIIVGGQTNLNGLIFLNNNVLLGNNLRINGVLAGGGTTSLFYLDPSDHIQFGGSGITGITTDPTTKFVGGGSSLTSLYPELFQWGGTMRLSGLPILSKPAHHGTGIMWVDSAGRARIDTANTSTGVTSVTSANSDIGVANTTTTPVLTLNNINGVTKTYYDVTSSIQTQLNTKVTSISGTTSRITSTGGSTPVIDISSTFENLLAKLAGTNTFTNTNTFNGSLISNTGINLQGGFGTSFYNSGNTFSTLLYNSGSTANYNVALPSASGTLALLGSPAFIGTPTVPTATGGTNTTQIASTAFVQSAIGAIATPNLQAVATSGNSYTGQISTYSQLINGTAGAGFINLLGQSSAPSTPAVNTQNIYADASGRFTIMGSNGFAASLSKALLTASRVYSFPDSTGTFALESRIIPNSNLANPSITINSTSTALGGSFTVTKSNTDTTSTGFATKASLIPYLTKVQIVATYAPISSVPLAANPSASIGLTTNNGSALTFMRSDATPALGQSITPVWTNLHTFSPTIAANTIVDGIYLNNPVASTTGNQEYSPSIHLRGFGQKTNSVAASQSVDYRITNVPVQGATVATANLVFDYSVNGGSYTNQMVLASGGLLGVGMTPTYNLDVTGKMRSSTGYIMGNDLGLFPVGSNQSVMQTWWGMQLSGLTQTSPTLYTAAQVGISNAAYHVVIPMVNTSAAGLAILGIGSQTGNYFEITSHAAKGTTHGDMLSFSSGGALGLGIVIPDASAIFDATNTTKGLLVPRMTTTQQNAIASPATGLHIINTTFNAPAWYTGSTWRNGILVNQATPSNGLIPIGNGTDFTLAAITQGPNISITNAAGSITIAGTSGFKTLFTNSDFVTVANTTTETSIIPAGVGSTTLPIPVQGTQFRATIGGVYSTTAITAGNLTVNVYYGSTLIATGTANGLVAGSTNAAFDGILKIANVSIGGSGSVYVSGSVNYSVGNNLARFALDLNNTGTAITVTNNSTQAFNVKVQWSAASASNSVKVTQFDLEQLN